MMVKLQFVALVLAAVTQATAQDKQGKSGHSHPISVHGRTLDPDGKPIPGATIFLVSTNSIEKMLGRTVSDENGRYEFRDVALPTGAPLKESLFREGTFQVFGKADGRAFAWCGMKKLYINPRPEWLNAEGKLVDSLGPSTYLVGEEMELDLTFPCPWPVRGVVLDDSGRGIRGTKVRLANCDYLDISGKVSHVNYREFWAVDQAAKLMPEQVLAVTDDEGKFELPFVPAGLMCWLSVTQPSYANLWLYTATTDRAVVHPRGLPVQSLPLEIKLSAAKTIEIIVREPETRLPLPDTRVVASQSIASGSSAAATSDQAGKLSLRIPAGRYKLHAMPPAETIYVPTQKELVVTDAPAVQSVEIALRLGCTLVLNAIDADTGAGVPGAMFMFTFERDGRNIRTSVRSDTGRSESRQSNEQGIVEFLLDPTKQRKFCIQAPQGYRAVNADDIRGRQLNLEAGKTVSAKFLLRKSD